MKKIFFFLAAICLFSACGQQTNYTINGIVQHVEDGSKVVLARFANYPFVSTDAPFTMIDSVIIQNGAFKFQGNVEPDTYVLRIDSVPASFLFFITGEGEEMDITLNGEDLLHSDITGSPVNERYVAYAKSGDSLNNAMEELMAAYAQKKGELSKNNRIKAAEKKRLLDEAEKEADAAYDALKAKESELTKAFVLANANNMAGQRMFFQMPYAFDVDDLTTLVAGIENKETEMARAIQTRLTNLKNVTTGSPFVDMELNDVNDKPVKLSSVAGKGTYVLVDFWASWCGPCRRENPNVVALYKQYRDKGFEVVGISRDNNKDAWLKGIAEDGLAWTHLWDKEGAACRSYVVDFIPATFLLDKEGKIIARGLHGDALRDKLKELLGE
ncbi:MAG: AhpC/TSA family protein [Prevotellaceae bacterium]|jgi:peroxiredoxin|nr:AhpC/TSA family protein [Prevotellaceae bacterium]